MKLSHIQEASYYGMPQLIKQIETIISEDKIPDQIDIEDTEQALEVLKARYGEKHKYDSYQNGATEQHTWVGVAHIPNSVDGSDKDMYRVDITLDMVDKIVEVY